MRSGGSDVLDGPLLEIALDESSALSLTRGRAAYKWVFVALVLALTGGIYVFVEALAVDHAIERASTATASFLLSVTVFVWFVARHEGLWALAFQYCLRGMTLAIVVAVFLESYSSAFLARSQLAATMLFVGFSEEGAKLLALLLLTSLDASRIVRPTNCCASLVESPRVLAFLGCCVGFGFMLSENVEYFVFVDLLKGADDEEEASELRLSRVLTGLLRSVLNLHPLLTGYVAARLATRLAKLNRTQTHAGDWLHALWLPALIHGGFDLAASLIPSVSVALALVATTWGGTWLLMNREIQKLPDRLNAAV